MLRNLAAALLATTLIAGPAFAAQPSADAGAKSVTAPAAVTTPVKHASAAKTVKHARIHARHHVAGVKHGMKHGTKIGSKARSVKMAQHGKVTRHKHVAHVAKPGIAGKTSKAS